MPTESIRIDGPGFDCLSFAMYLAGVFSLDSSRSEQKNYFLILLIQFNVFIYFTDFLIIIIKKSARYQKKKKKECHHSKHFLDYKLQPILLDKL